MAKKPADLQIPDGMRWDHCKGKLVPLEVPRVRIVETGWPDTHRAEERRSRLHRRWG